MISNSTIIVPDDPVFIDLALAEFQTALSSLTWLNFVFGKAELRTEIIDGRTIEFPANYVALNEGKEYDKLFPDEHLGNFSFFKITDGENTVMLNQMNANVETEFGLIVWFDFREVFPSPEDWKLKTVNNVKSQIADVIRAFPFQKSTVTINRYWDEPQNVYSGYTISAINQTFSLRPFGCLKIEGTIRYFEKDNC